MTTTFTLVGDKLAIFLDAPTLERLGIDADTPVVVTSDGQGIHIKPILFAAADQVEMAADELMEIHANTLTRLAE